ncbi:substrate-binding periplasmic protein [Nitrincola sp. MINF-07-Sa-05]|uniref:substrate-binding periplasmic protein n=1 Tax=Nitrincola salilacus TaxID=3400273 RepID=UPI003917EC1A
MKHHVINGMIVTLFFMIGALLPTPILAETPSITLHYNERVPYLVTTPQGEATGLTATPAQQAFELAGIPFVWELTPSKRQMQVVQENEGYDCLVGWFKNPEREKFAKYTLPIYQDQPQIAIARADNSELRSGMSVDELLSHPKLFMEAKDGYSYGKFLDEKIAQHKPNIEKAIVENIQMLMKVQVGRSDYFFIAPEEADGLLALSNFSKEDFQYVTFSDMPQGEYRYILCSQQVSDAIIQRLDAAIQEKILPTLL